MAERNDEQMKASARLEPRVATLETELRQVVKSIGELTTGFGEFTKTVESQFRSMAVLLERVAAPKQTNWAVLVGVSVSVTMLFITIGGLVLYPMSKEFNGLAAWREKHSDLELHPVGKTRIDALEKAVTERAEMNAAGIRELDAKLQKEYQLMDASVRERVGSVEREVRERWVVDKAGIEGVSDKTDAVKDTILAMQSRITVLETQSRMLNGNKSQ